MLRKWCIVLTFLSLLTSCFGGDDYKEVAAGNITPVTTDEVAEFCVKDVAEVSRGNVRGTLSNGSYSDQVVTGMTGTATVSGTISYLSGISCGSSCVRSENNTDITITFNNFKSKTAGNTETTISGTVRFRDTTYSQQSGLSYSSGGMVRVDGSGVSYYIIDVDGSWGYSDTMSFDASGSSVIKMSGSCSPSNGNSYYF